MIQISKIPEQLMAPTTPSIQTSKDSNKLATNSPNEVLFSFVVQQNRAGQRLKVFFISWSAELPNS